MRVAHVTPIPEDRQRPLGPGFLADLRQNRYDQRRRRQDKDKKDIFQKLRMRRRQVSDDRWGTNPETQLQHITFLLRKYSLREGR